MSKIPKAPSNFRLPKQLGPLVLPGGKKIKPLVEEPPEGDTVIDTDFIQEFVTNSERQLFEVIKAKIDDINKAIPSKDVNHTCDECGHSYTAPFTFDQSNFFVFAS